MTLLKDLWPSSNCFTFGCCISGPKKYALNTICWYTFALISAVLISIFVTPTVWKQVSPALPICFYVMIVFTSAMNILTSCTDPGIIPRRPFLQRIKNNIYTNSLEQNQRINNIRQFLSPPPPPMQEQSSLNMKANNESALPTTTAPQTKKAQPYRFCNTCEIFRPPRASHCGTCGNCVLVFDHHCGFMNNCIGKRNYRFFVMFFVGLCFSILLLYANLILFGYHKFNNAQSALIYIIVVASVGGVILVCIGQTTRERLKHIKNQQKQQNQFCMVDPSLIDFFEEIPPQQQNLLKQQLKKMENPLEQNKQKQQVISSSINQNGLSSRNVQRIT